MSLKDAVKNAQATKTTENTSGKNPAYYAKQKQSCIDGCCTSPVTEVRLHMASDVFTPTNNLKDMLTKEADKDVLSILLQNERIPAKALNDFMESERVELFNEDDDAYQFVVKRLGLDKNSDNNTETESGIE